MAVAIGNEGGAFAKAYDLGRPDDAVVLSLFKGVDHWIFSVEDADAIVLRAAAACAGGDAEAINRTIEALVKQGRDAIDRVAMERRPGEDNDRSFRMTQALLDNLRVEHTDRSVALHAEGFGTLADFAAMVEDEVRSEAEPRNRKEAAKASRP
jgi:hypothetical protein